MNIKNLVVDIGNSFCKIALFENEKMSRFERCLHSEILTKINTLAFERAIVSDVSKSTALFLKNQGFEFLEMSNDLFFPFRIAYETPKTLGVDRIAAIAGAWAIQPNKASLVIDAGTCITYDFISAEGVYEGGSISPGLTMRFRALHEQTGRLPLLEKMSLRPNLIGKTTFDAMQSGVMNGFIGEIESILRAYRQRYGADICTYICGGDAEFIAEEIKDFTKISELVMLGLNAILTNN